MTTQNYMNVFVYIKHRNTLFTPNLTHDVANTIYMVVVLATLFYKFSCDRTLSTAARLVLVT